MSFKTIETQEELDAIIGERIERAKSSVRKEYDEKYSDYDSIKDQIGKYNSEKENYEKQIKELNDKVSSFDEISAQNKKLQMDSLKVRVALENGLPYQMASRLNGDDEDSIIKDAKMMKQYMPGKKLQPLKDTEGNINEKDEKFKKLLRGLKINE